MNKKRKIYIGFMRSAMIVCTALTAALVLFLMGYVLVNGIPNISWELLSTKPSYLTERIGILPDILNTINSLRQFIHSVKVTAQTYIIFPAERKNMFNMPESIIYFCTFARKKLRI